MSKTHWKKVVAESDYLGEADFEENEEKVGTIARVVKSEKIKSAEGTSDKAVVYFKEDALKPLILNVARSKSITKVAGSPFFEDWVGVPIQMYLEHGIKAFGDIVSAVRVRPKRPNVQAKKVLTCEDCGSVIQGVMGKGADYIAAYTQKKYGATLCYSCGLKRAEAAAPKTEENENEN